MKVLHSTTRFITTPPEHGRILSPVTPSGGSAVFSAVRTTLGFLAVGAAVLTAGCGSGALRTSGNTPLGAAGGAGGNDLSAAAGVSLGIGRAAIMIHWPARDKATSRLIPTASQSIVVQIVRTVGGKPSVLQSQTVPRPADPTDGTAPISTVTFTNLPIDTFSVTATAYPTSTGTGTAQATGTGSVTTTADGNPASFSVIMDSTIDHLTVIPESITLLGGKTVPLVVTAYSASGAVVLLTPTKLMWSASNATVSVDGNGLVTAGQAAGTSVVTVTDAESGKSISTNITVLYARSDSVGPAQFNPSGGSYAGSLKADNAGTTPYVGGWNTVSGHNYQFNTGTVTAGSGGPLPTLTDTTTGTVIAYGKLVTQTCSQDVKSVTYAVFDFPGDIAIGSGCQVTAVTGNTNPLVLLTQGSFTLGSNAILNVSASGTSGGAGGWNSGQGPGTGKVLSYGSPLYRSGSSFGGLGGGLTSGTYGSDFHDAAIPHLQGGSGSGGGAIYFGSVGPLVVSGGITANGGDGSLISGSGSGGGIVLFGGGGVQLTGAAIAANGARGNSGQVINTRRVAGGSGGGRIVIGYASGSAPSKTGVTASGGAAPTNEPYYKGGDGTVDVIPFSGF